MKFRLLLAQCNRDIGSIVVQYTKPSQYYSYLLKNYSEFKTWIKPEIFNEFPDWPDDVTVMAKKKNISNIAGDFIKENINTITTVMNGNATPERLISELKKDSYTHVGLGVYVSSYSTFIECAKAIRKYNPNIKIIAGNIGAIFKGTEKYVDHVCIGRGVPYLRKLFNEDLNREFQPGLSPDLLEISYKNQNISLNCIEFCTKLGCPYNCDFCITNKFFKGQYTKELISPQEAYEILTNYRKKLGNKDFSIYWAEPNAIISHEWFYELFELFKNESGDYSIVVMPTTANSLRDLDLDQISNSALRIGSVNIGVESFDKKYSKNLNIDFKKLFEKLTNYGIGSYATYIIGFPHETEEVIWEGIDYLLDLNATVYSILNLKVLPKTIIWKKLKSENKILDVPPDLRYIDGFQAFKHKSFKPGFEDIWPLLYNIYRHIEKENGNIATNFYGLMKNLIKINPKKIKLFRRNMLLYQNISKMIFPAWKAFFKPSKQQVQKYLEKVDLT